MFLLSQPTLLVMLMAIQLRALMMYLAQQMPSNLSHSYQNFTASSNVLNYAKFTAVIAASIALKQYLKDQKILLTSA